MREVSIARGIEIMTTIVGRHEPRNSKIISAVSPAAIAPSRSTLTTDETTKTDWSNSGLMTMPDGAAARAVTNMALTALTTDNVEALPFLMMLSRTDRSEKHGGAVRETDWDVIERLDRRRHRIGSDRVLGLADLRGASGQGQVLAVDGGHHLQRGQTLCQKLSR